MATTERVSIELASLGSTVAPASHNNSNVAATIRPSPPLSSDSSLSRAAAETSPEPEHSIAALPPVDRGRGAWLFLAAATLMEACVWGLPYSIGVMHAYWSTQLFPGAESTLTLASTLMSGLLLLAGALVGPLFTTLPWYERYFQIIGLVISSVGLLVSAFVTEPWQLLITIGIMYPFSAATYFPCATNIFEWFQERRGLATGVLFAGSGAGGSIFPLIMTALLSCVGYKATMVSIAVAFAVLNAVAMPFIKRRVPLPRGAGARVRPKINWAFLRSRAPWVACVCTTIISLANFIPLLWLPSYAETVNATKPDGAVVVSVMNALAMGGNLLAGYLSDRMAVGVVNAVSTAIAAAACLLLWGFGTTGAWLVSFAVIWGLTGGSQTGSWGRIIAIMAGDDPTVPSIAFSAMVSLKGIGSFASGPISSALLQYGKFRGASGAYGNTNYGALLIFTAAMTAVGGSLMLAYPRR